VTEWERIVREIAAGTPYRADEHDGGPLCFWCCASGDDDHSADCLWMRARELVAKSPA